jgi:phosphinothricin acetyltransferase
VPEAEEAATIRNVELRDAKAVAAIYNHYVTTSIVTFEEESVTASEIARRIEEVQSTSLPWLIGETRSQLSGYAYATRWRTRSAYRFAAEVTVYVAPGSAGRGIGSKLYAHLLPKLRSAGIHSVIGGIALPNQASVALHEKFGFRKAAHFEEVGFKFGRWIDVGYWQLTL